MVKILFNKKIQAVILEFCIVILVVILIEILLLVPYNMLKLILENFQEGFIMNLCLLIISISIYLFLPLENILKRYEEKLSKMYFFIISIIAYIIFSKYIWDTYRGLLLGQITIFFIMPIIYVAINIIFLFYNNRIKEQEKTIEIFNQYNPIVNNLVEEVKRRQHDFKNHLNTIYGIIEVTDEEFLKEELKSYIKLLNQSLHEVDLLICVGNKVLCGIIYSKVFLAKTNNINFLYEIQGDLLKLPMKDYEMSEILNNMIDNAFEVVESNNKGEKEVSLKIWNEREKLIIEVKNIGEAISEKNPAKFFKRGYTTKGKAGHGYGLYNVKSIVEKYHGTILLSFEDHYTIFRMLF